MDYVVVAINTSQGSGFFNVTLQAVSAPDGIPQSTISLSLPLADASNYLIGQTYSLSLTQAKAK